MKGSMKLFIAVMWMIQIVIIACNYQKPGFWPTYIIISLFASLLLAIFSKTENHGKNLLLSALPLGLIWFLYKIIVHIKIWADKHLSD